MFNTRNLILATVLAAVAATVLAACGGSESSSTAGASPESEIVASSDRISTTTRAATPARFPSGKDNDEISPTGAAPKKPCNLVSKAKASAILGTAVQVTTGPQGPTCIYERLGSTEVMTLAVERTSLPSLRNRAKTANRVTVAGRDAWCLHYGSTSVAVPLAEGNVLRVTGPCETAMRFAAGALSSIE
ncbi:MAG: DUF3558 family protein [Solirubrobacterales bacterium]